MSSPSLSSLPFKGVQLDLARQPETLELIRSFIDFAAGYGYNHLVLYLEGRIRTKSFPFRKADQSYTPEEIRDIVHYAQERGMETVPVISLFGHAEHFLACRELEGLAELREGGMGRFSRTKNVFCPSLEATRDFIGTYLAEVAELFPSPYFHVGFDEVWDIGYCSLCRERLKQETQADLFLEHLLFCHRLVSGELGKRMIIWDDLFDIYPGTLEQVPRDIILCSWHYDQLVDLPAGHCGGPRADHLALYDKLGFEYLFAPSSFSIRNVETFSAYAMRRKPLGALMTTWALERRFLLSDYPTIAYAGLLWSGSAPDASGAELQYRAIREVTSCADATGAHLLKAYLNTRDIELVPVWSCYLRGPLSEQEFQHRSLVEAARSWMMPQTKSGGGALADHVLHDIALDLETESLFFELREVLSGLYGQGSQPAEKASWKRRAAACRTRMEALQARRRDQWNLHRCGLHPCSAADVLDSVLAMLDRAIEGRSRVRALLKISFGVGQANLDVLLKYQGSQEWETVAGGFRKSPGTENSVWFPLENGEPPEQVRIEGWGYVGVGIIFVEVEGPSLHLQPASVRAVGGKVWNPEALLENGRDACILGEGEQKARAKFLNPELSRVRHVIEVQLKQVGTAHFVNGRHGTDGGIR